MENQIEKLSKTYEDFWAKHNLTTRTGIFLFVIVYVLSVVGVLYSGINPAIAKIILDTTSYVALFSLLTVILGSNTIVKIAEILNNKKTQSIIENINNKTTEKDEDLNPPKIY